MANYPKFRAIAIAMGKDVSGLTAREAAALSVEAVEELRQDVGIPMRLSDIGVPADALEGIIRDAATFRLLPNSPRQLQIEDLRVIVSRALGL